MKRSEAIERLRELSRHDDTSKYFPLLRAARDLLNSEDELPWKVYDDAGLAAAFKSELLARCYTEPISMVRATIVGPEDDHAEIVPQSVEQSANAEHLPVITFRPWEPKTLADVPPGCWCVGSDGVIYWVDDDGWLCMFARENVTAVVRGLQASEINIARILGFPEFRQEASDE